MNIRAHTHADNIALNTATYDFINFICNLVFIQTKRMKAVELVNSFRVFFSLNYHYFIMVGQWAGQPINSFEIIRNHFFKRKI